MRSSASLPVVARTTLWPAFSSSRTASFWFTGLSSASRILSGRPFGLVLDGRGSFDQGVFSAMHTRTEQNCVEQFGLADGFSKEHIDAEITTARSVGQMSIGGKHQDDGAGQCRIFSNLLR